MEREGWRMEGGGGGVVNHLLPFKQSLTSFAKFCYILTQYIAGADPEIEENGV